MDAQELHQLSRAEIQKLAKVHGVKANLKSANIIAQLVALLPAGVPRLPRAPSPTASETGQKLASPRQSQNQNQNQNSKKSRAGRTPGVPPRRSARLRSQPRPTIDEDPEPAEARPNAPRKTPRAKPAPRTKNPKATIKQESRSDIAAEPAARRGASPPTRGVRWAPTPTPGARVAEWRERLYAGRGSSPSPEPILDPDAAPLDPTTETRVTRAQADFVTGELGEMRAAGVVVRRVREVCAVVAGIAAVVREVREDGEVGGRVRMRMRGVLEGALEAQARERREGLRGARGEGRGQARVLEERRAGARGQGSSKRKRGADEDEDEHEDEDEAAYRAVRSRAHAGELWAPSPSSSVEGRGQGSKRERDIDEDEDEDADEAAHRSRAHAGELWASSPSGSVEV